jgi:pilus assembly protein CpaB
VVPGTKVDVLVTIRQQRESVSRIVVSNVQVLTAGTRYDEAEAKKAGKAIASTVVTLMVSPADAERIALAGTEGQIMLALRNPLDTETTHTPGIRSAALFDSEPVIAVPTPRVAVRRAVRVEAPLVAVPVVLPIAEVIRPTVETIRAGKRERESLR